MAKKKKKHELSEKEIDIILREQPMNYTGPGNYEFTFVVVMEGENMQDALVQARELLSMDDFEPVSVDCLEQYEEES
jgi:hypothetical protein